jgi:hypothetical protein
MNIAIIEGDSEGYYSGFGKDRLLHHAAIIDRIHETYKTKNAAYGNSFDRSLDRWGYQAALVRMDDKMNRLEQLLLWNGAANDESALDTALDLANYSVMLAMYIESKQ